METYLTGISHTIRRHFSFIFIQLNLQRFPFDLHLNTSQWVWILHNEFNIAFSWRYYPPDMVDRVRYSLNFMPSFFSVLALNNFIYKCTVMVPFSSSNSRKKLLPKAIDFEYEIFVHLNVSIYRKSLNFVDNKDVMLNPKI